MVPGPGPHGRQHDARPEREEPWRSATTSKAERGGCWQPARERDETTSTRNRGAVPVGESVTAMLEGEETRVIFSLES